MKTDKIQVVEYDDEQCCAYCANCGNWYGEGSTVHYCSIRPNKRNKCGYKSVNRFKNTCRQFESSNRPAEPEPTKAKICGECALHVPSFMGCACLLTDNAVEYDQEACIDYIPENE